MQETAALSRWFGDRNAQAETIRHSLVGRQAWLEAGDCVRLRERLDAASGDPDAVAAIAAGLLDGPDLADAFIATMMARLAGDPFFLPPMPPLRLPTGSGVRLFEHDDLTVSLIVIDPDSLALKKRAGPDGRAIVFSGQLALRRILRGGDALIQRFVAEPASPTLSLGRQAPCRPGDREPLVDGGLFVVDGRVESFTLLHARSAVVWLECEVLAGRAPFRVEYDAVTLRPIAAASTDMAASRAQMMLSALQVLDAGATPALCDRMLDHPSFELRWHAMREMMSADAGQAWPRLARLAQDDAHPEIRAAAAQVLAAHTPGGPSCHA